MWKVGYTPREAREYAKTHPPAQKPAPPVQAKPKPL